MSIKLYSFQDDAVTKLLDGFEKHQTQCLSFYTGAGKTNVFSRLCEILVEGNSKVKIGISAYLTTEIRDQIRDRLTLFNLESKINVIGPESFDPTKNVFIFNPHAIFRKEAAFKFDYLFIDEAHAGMNVDAKMLGTIFNTWVAQKTRILLISATPWDLLAQKRFKNTPVLTRSLHDGLKDGLITDFELNAEEAQIEFDPDDFSREGDLTFGTRMKKFRTIKSACFGKMENLIARKDSKLGQKVLVICPPGNKAEIAKEMAEHFGGLSFTEWKKRGAGIESKGNLDRFRKDPKVRFLFVVNKCSVGFDMSSLTSIVDLTMTRNIKVLTQRIGRIARKSGDLKKAFFYVYDRSLRDDKLDWLIFTIIDLSLGQFDGITTRSVKHRPVQIKAGGGGLRQRTPLFSEIVDTLAKSNAVEGSISLRFWEGSKQRTDWTVETALAAASKFHDRTTMWRERPEVYKWLRINAKNEMDLLFPIKNQLGKWNEETVIAAMKQCKSRQDFKKKFSGAQWWIAENKREDLKDKIFGPSKSAKKWTTAEIKRTIDGLEKWSDIRNMALRQKLARDGQLDKWRTYYMKSRGEDPSKGLWKRRKAT